MSNFIVSQKTMNIITKGIFDLGNSTYEVGAMKKEITKLGIEYSKEHMPQSSTEDGIGNMLLSLNKKAFCERHNEEFEYVTHYKHCEILDFSDAQFLKSLQCLIYQCSEGEVVNSDLYDTLKKLERFFMMHIIKKLTDYKNCGWD